MRKNIIFIVASILTLTGCGNNTAPVTPVDPEPVVEALSINDMAMYVYGENNDIVIENADEGETYTYQYEGSDIRIEDNKVIALRGNTQTEVKVTSSNNREGTFTVNVLNRQYTSTHQQTETNQGWFNEVNITKINSMTSEFANGMDISSAKWLYECGQRFYDKNGVETSLFLILKESGVNWVRLRLWNDPKDTYEEGGVTKTFQYGGGNCDLARVTWMAKEAKASGLKVLLDLHYSDFWADPSKQVIPKAWANFTTTTQMANAIHDYTKETVEYMRDHNAKPDMVAIGNECAAGMLSSLPGETTTSSSGGNPIYIVGASKINKSSSKGAISGEYHDEWLGTDKNNNFHTFVKAGHDAVKEVDANILTTIHFVRGLSDPQMSIRFFNFINDIGFDVYSLSAYSYWHYTTISTLRNGYQTIANTFPNKKLAIAETSYGFTFETDTNASNSYVDGGSCGPVSGYPTNIQGQAQMLRDTTEVISDLSNGFGVFYWEGAWPPCKKAGWADSASKATWANQGFFSYNGKALGSLEVYNKMLGN